MSEWQRKRIGDFLTLEYGKPLHKSLRKESGKYPAYGANGIKCRTDEFYCDKETLIIGRKGSAGEVTITEKRFWPLDVTYFVDFDTELYDLNFIYFLLKTLDLPSLATGVKPGINRNKVYAIEVNVPEMVEQKRIVTILQQAFHDLEKARTATVKNIENAKELFDSYLSKVFLHKGVAWLKAELSKHVKFIDYRGKTPIKLESGMRLITAKNVRMGFLRKEPEEFVSPDSYDDWMTRGIPQKGDVLFTTEAPLANVAQLDTDEKVVLAQRIITMQPDARILNSTFLKFALMSAPIQKKIHEKGTGATATGIKASLLKKIEIDFPDNLVEQKRIAETLVSLSQHVEALRKQYERKLYELESLKKSILQKAFTGELTKSKGVAA